MAAILSPSVKGKRVSIFIIITHSLLPHLACSFQARIPGCICTTSYGPTFVHTNWLLLTALLPGSFCKYSKFYFLKIERNVITRWFHSFLFFCWIVSPWYLNVLCPTPFSPTHTILHHHESRDGMENRFWDFLKYFLLVFRGRIQIKKKKLVNYTFVSTQKLMTAHSKAPYCNLKTLLTVSQMNGNKSWGLVFGWHIYSLGK